MRTDLLKIAALPFIAATFLSTTVMAQQLPPTPEEQLSQRITEYSQKVDKAAGEGKLNSRQVASDKKRAAELQEQLNKAVAKRQGHLTDKDLARFKSKLDKEDIKERAQENKPKKLHIRHTGNLMKTPKK